MDYKIPANLLGTQNNKTVKGEKYGWITHIMYLASHTQNTLGTNVCSHASAGCISACLFGAGRGSFSSVEKARVNKTNYFLADRQGFFNQLVKEIDKKVKAHKKAGKKEGICIRLNGTSDIRFEKFKISEGKNLFELFPDVQFYDYTKNYLRFDQELPANYHLTFSRSETNEDKALEVLQKGGNVAIVFEELPETYKGYKVINGDESDLRFKDEKNVVVGLKYKKLTAGGADNKEAFKSGFAITTKVLNA